MAVAVLLWEVGARAMAKKASAEGLLAVLIFQQINEDSDWDAAGLPAMPAPQPGQHMLQAATLGGMVGGTGPWLLCRAAPICSVMVQQVGRHEHVKWRC